ncbi:DUF5681 domain-containing protein [Mesorhizobium marinum]|uniref:DUF5681 domain-containing protein n=1 Tax=Mesorhizobium marinum TaxID=3228790 RepID=UPI0034670418
MTRKNKTPKPPSDRPYEVGYGKPPVASQFKPGQCPNPKGRPKGSKNKPADIEDIENLVFEEGGRQMKIAEGERVIPVSVAKAVIRRIALEAMKGKYRQQKLWTDLQTRAQEKRERGWDELMGTWIAYKIKMEEKIAHNARLGLPPPEDMVVHPDQIVVDPYTDTFELRGPLTRQEKRELEETIAQLVHNLKEPVLERIAKMQAALADTADRKLRAEIKAAIKDDERLLDLAEEIGRRRLHYFTTGHELPPPE